MVNRIKSDAKNRKIVGKGTSGDFIKASQTMNEKYRNVSDAWVQKCSTYDETFNELSLIDRNNADLRISPDKVRAVAVEGEGGAGVGFAVYDDAAQHSHYVPTDFAWARISDWIGLKTYSVSDWCKPMLAQNGRTLAVPTMEQMDKLAALINSFMDDRLRNDQYLYRLNNSDGTLRCMMSDQYAIIDNHWWLEQFQDMIPDGLVSHRRGNSDTFICNVIVPSSMQHEDDSDYGAMVYMGNSEIGERVLFSEPSLYRAICCNGQIHNRSRGEKFRVKHKRKGGSISLEHIREELESTIFEQLDLIKIMVPKMLQTQKYGWDGASIKPVLFTFGNRVKLQKTEFAKVLEGYREEIAETPSVDKTAFSLINGLTRAAQVLGDQRYEDLNRMAGSILDWNESQWRNIFNDANHCDSSEVDKVFSTN